MATFASPLSTLLSAWLFMLGLYYSGIIVYHDVPDGTWGMVYVAISLALFALGYCLTAEREEGSPPDFPHDGETDANWKEEIHRLRLVISIFAAGGIAAALLFSYEMLFIVDINPFDLFSTRELYVEREATLYSQIASVLGMGGFFSLVSVILCWEHVSPFYRVFWLLSPVFLSVFSVFSAGRQTVLQLVLISFFALSVKRISGAKSIPSKTLKIFIIIFSIMILGYGMVIAQQRNLLELRISKKDVLMQMQNAQLHPWLDKTLDDLPPVIRDGVAEMIVYFSHEIPNYIAFWELPRDEIYFGLWEQPFLARRLKSLGIISYSYKEKMEEEYARFEMSGRVSKVWHTGIRDLIMDFGLLGTLIISGILGLLSGRVYRRFQSTRSLSAAFLLVGINLWCAYSIMLTVVRDTLVFFYMMMAIFFYFLPNHRPKITEQRTIIRQR